MAKGNVHCMNFFLLSPYLAVKKSDQFDIAVNVRYSLVTKNESKQNESIAR